MTAAEIAQLVEAAFREGFTAGHSDGISCGHALAPRCRCTADEDWLYSDARQALLALTQEPTP